MREETILEIRKALSDNATRLDMMTILYGLIKEGKVHADAQLRQEAELRTAERIKALKALKPGKEVYTRLIEHHTKTLRKVKDGRTNMLVQIDGKMWTYPYSSLQVEPLNQDQKVLGKILKSIPQP